MDIFIGTLFIVICILLIVVVLLQKGRGGGLSAAFGGAGSSAFGTRTGDVFTWVTVVLTALYLLLAIGASFVARPDVQQVDAPRFRPPSSELPKGTPVAIASGTPGATIYFTTDGTEPTKQSRKYTVPEPFEAPVTVKARAFNKGMRASEIATAVYTRPMPAAGMPYFQPMGGPITGPTQVTIRSATDDAVIRYTLDDSEPTEQSPVYESPVTVRPDQTLKARAFAEGHKPSEIQEATYAPRPATTQPSGE